MTTAAVAALALGGASACVSETPFLCTDSAQCISDGEGGTCESTGFCSFEDAECESGRRYGKAAGDGLANECVEGGVGGCAGNLSLTAGSDHTCAFDSTGTVSCWGADYGGQLGDGHELRDHSTPQPVPLVPPVIEIDPVTCVSPRLAPVEYNPPLPVAPSARIGVESVMSTCAIILSPAPAATSVSNAVATLFSVRT